MTMMMMMFYAVASKSLVWTNEISKWSEKKNMHKVPRQILLLEFVFEWTATHMPRWPD